MNELSHFDRVEGYLQKAKQVIAKIKSLSDGAEKSSKI